MAAASKTREILVILRNGKRRKVSNVPATAKITYGPVSPKGMGYGEGNALRIYTSAQNQLAVFLDVLEFRDLSLVVQEQKVSRKRSESETSNAKGRKVVVDAEESIEWETPDA